MSCLNDFVSSLKLLITEYEQLKAISEAQNADSERLNRIIVAILLQCGGAVDVSHENVTKLTEGIAYTMQLSQNGVLFRLEDE